MNPSRLLISLLLLAILVFDCAALADAGTRQWSPHLALILAWALQLSQISLVAIWLALGRTSVPWRLTAAVAAIGVWSCVLATLPDALELPQWVVLLTLQTAIVTVPLLLMRPLGLTLIDVSSAAEVERSTLGAKRFQFSILSLIGWTTALAAVLSTVKSVAPDGRFALGAALGLPMLVFLAGRTMVALAAAWLALGRGRSSLRIAAMSVAVVAAFALQPLSQSASADSSRYLAILCLLEALLLIGPLGVVRVAGYRLAMGKGDAKDAHGRH